MNGIESLVQEYERTARLPWDKTLAGAQRVWFAIYEPTQERRVRFRLDDFGVATKGAGHQWIPHDLKNEFAEWMAKHEYRDAYFEQPEDMSLALEDFSQAVTKQIKEWLTAPNVDDNSVVAIVGLGSLFGLTHASTVLNAVTSFIRGRLLVFFPGHHEGSNYRLLDARDGWNYLAVPITAKKSEVKP